MQVALAVTMPSRLLTIVVLLANPFWFDLWLGNIKVLVLWLASWGLTGRRWAVVGYLVLAVLVPRPLVIPLAVWFLWKEPWVRLPFVAMFGLHALGVVASGWGDEWLARLAAAAGNEVRSPYNYGPSQFIGMLWLPIGLVLGAVAWHRGRPALAGLLVAPYWLPYYFLLPLAELALRRETARRAANDRAGLFRGFRPAAWAAVVKSQLSADR